MIRFDGVAVLAEGRPGAPDVMILDDVDLTLTEHRVAVVGANGSGKSTLARLINGLVLPTAGRVLVDGLDTARDGTAVRRRVGFVFTDPDAQLVMPTPREDVALSLRRLRIDAADRDERVRAILDRFGLAGLAEVSVHALSGGQKQLLALAGVLAVEPALLVCDEPTTLLDLRWRRVVDELLESLDQQVLVVTHDLGAAVRADRVLVVDGGRIAADGAATVAVEAYRDRMARGGPLTELSR